jgi:hypothetical protein
LSKINNIKHQETAIMASEPASSKSRKRKTYDNRDDMVNAENGILKNVESDYMPDIEYRGEPITIIIDGLNLLEGGSIIQKIADGFPTTSKSFGIIHNIFYVASVLYNQILLKSQNPIDIQLIIVVKDFPTSDRSAETKIIFDLLNQNGNGIPKDLLVSAKYIRTSITNTSRRDDDDIVISNLAIDSAKSGRSVLIFTDDRMEGGRGFDGIQATETLFTNTLHDAPDTPNHCVKIAAETEKDFKSDIIFTELVNTSYITVISPKIFTTIFSGTITSYIEHLAFNRNMKQERRAEKLLRKKENRKQRIEKLLHNEEVYQYKLIN